jgi:hypothetical protein
MTPLKMYIMTYIVPIATYVMMFICFSTYEHYDVHYDDHYICAMFIMTFIITSTNRKP